MNKSVYLSLISSFFFSLIFFLIINKSINIKLSQINNSNILSYSKEFSGLKIPVKNFNTNLDTKLNERNKLVNNLNLLPSTFCSKTSTSCLESYLSLFKNYNKKFNFISIGSCDGTHDTAISHFKIELNWNGLFVEAFDVNFKSLKTYLEKFQDRAELVYGAVTDICEDKEIDFYFFKEVDETWSHWKKFQIPSLTLKKKYANAFNNNKLGTNSVPCLVFDDLMDRFRSRFSSDLIHLLKIDTEGTDFFIVYSLITKLIDGNGDNFPIIIFFEVSFIDKLDLARLIKLLERYYIVKKDNINLIAILKENI